MITHLPIFGSILGALVLGYGIFKKSDATVLASYYLFVISSIGAAVAYLTGEEAEESVENIQGVSENIIEQHSDFANYAFIALIVLGVISLIGIYVTLTKYVFARTVSVMTLFLALFSFALVARTGYLGGQIRHTEIATGEGQNTSQQKADDD